VRFEAGRAAKLSIKKPESKSPEKKGGQSSHHTPSRLLFVRVVFQSFPLGVSPHLAWGREKAQELLSEKIGGRSGSWPEGKLTKSRASNELGPCGSGTGERARRLE
jgi:hypothetical protein